MFSFIGQIFLGYDLHVMIKLREELNSEIPESLLRKAEENELATDEETYLDMWNIHKFLLAAGFREESIMCDRSAIFWKKIRNMVTDLENKLAPAGTKFPVSKNLKDVYTEKIDEILKKIREQMNKE